MGIALLRSPFTPSDPIMPSCPYIISGSRPAVHLSPALCCAGSLPPQAYPSSGRPAINLHFLLCASCAQSWAHSTLSTHLSGPCMHHVLTPHHHAARLACLQPETCEGQHRMHPRTGSKDLCLCSALHASVPWLLSASSWWQVHGSYVLLVGQENSCQILV